MPSSKPSLAPAFPSLHHLNRFYAPFFPYTSRIRRGLVRNAVYRQAGAPRALHTFFTFSVQHNTI